MKLAQKVCKQAQRRRWRVRNRVSGCANRPRLSVHFSNKHIYAQCIDDCVGRTLVALSSSAYSAQNRETVKMPLKPNKDGAETFGAAFGKLIEEKGIRSVVFDRGPRRYHGCVKIFADAVRKLGVEF
jgi:large subunit ribosomal protein L18